MSSTQQLYDELLEGYLILTREELKDELLSLINNEGGGLNDKICEVVNRHFVKFSLPA